MGARRRVERAFLRRAYEVGRIHARRLRHDLHVLATSPRGRITLHEGREALREWFQGLDPSLRLRDQIERMPEARLDVPREPRRSAPRRHALAR